MWVEESCAAATRAQRLEMGLSVTSALMVVLVTSRNVAKNVAVVLERKVVTFFILAGECHRAGTLETERYKTTKILIKII